MHLLRCAGYFRKIKFNIYKIITNGEENFLVLNSKFFESPLPITVFTLARTYLSFQLNDFLTAMVFIAKNVNFGHQFVYD